MALEGAATYTTVSYSETETEDMVITYPDAEDMNENDPNYDKAGTSETIQVPKQILTTDTYEYVYVWVKQIEVFNNMIDGVKKTDVIYQYAGYESKDAKAADMENFLFWNTREVPNLDYNLNLWSQCYNDLKTLENFKDLTNC